MGPKMSKDYLITEIRKREKFRDFVYRGYLRITLNNYFYCVLYF